MRHLLLATLLLSGLPGLAHAQSIMVEQPWARATPGHAATGSVYLTITEHGDADSLTGVSTPVAGMAMLHETVTENGVAKMRMLESIALPPHTPVTFKPGSLHIMLTGLKEPLKQGGSFPLTLSFAHAAPVTVNVPVLAAGSAGPGASGGGEMKDMPGMKMD